MIHARARCWIHEDCLIDLELSIACGPNPLDMQVLGGDWAYGDWADGDGYGVGGGDGRGIFGRGIFVDGEGDGWGDGDGGGGYGGVDSGGGAVQGGQR